MLTAKQVKEAIETGHSETCTGEGGCIHAKALSASKAEIQADIVHAALVGVQVGGPQMIGASIWNCGFHAGYRAAQLVAEAETSKGKAN